MKCIEKAQKELEALGLSDIITQDVMTILNEMNQVKEEADVLFNAEESVISELEEFSNKYKNIQNKPRLMLKLFKALGSVDKVQPNEKHRKHLEDVLKIFVDSAEEYIQETTILVQKKFAGKNQGAYSPKKNEIYLGISVNDPDSANAMSVQEVFVHEVIHAATEHAKTDNKAQVVHALHMLDQMYEQASKIKPNAELSQETLDYIFNRNIDKPHHGVSEFIAYGLTNEAFIKELSKIKVLSEDKKPESMSEMLALWFKRLVNFVFGLERGARGLTIDEGLMKFSIELARANNTAGKEVQRSILMKVTEAVNTLDEYIVDKIDSKIQPIRDMSVYEIYGKYGKTKGTLLMPLKLWVDKDMKDRLATYLDKTGHDIFDKRNTLQTIWRQLRDTDSYDMIIQKMGYESNKVEIAKKHRETNMVKLAKEGFKEEPTREEDTALGHAVIETDMQVLQGYNTEQLQAFLNSDDAIYAEAKRLLDELDLSDRTRNMYKVKLEDLGHYMATGTSRILGGMLNTKTIASMTEGGDISHQANMDKIASLMAIRYTSKASRELASKMLTKDEDGVRNLMELHKAAKKNADEMLFSKESDYTVSQKIQGYTRDVLNPDMDTKVAPANEIEKMRKDGYVRAEILPKSKYDTSGVQMAVYVSNEAAKQPWHRRMLHISDKGTRGTTFTEVHVANHGTSGFLSAEENIEAYKRAVKIAEEQMMKGTYVPSESIMPVPLRNMNGDIIDVRYTMSKASKVKYLQRDSRATVMLGRTDSSAIEKALSEQFNLDAIDIIIDDMHKNMTQDTRDQYIDIYAESTDPEVKEMWTILPEYLKRHIKSKLGEKGILSVRKDVYRDIFGYRGFTLDSAAKQNEAYRLVRFAIRTAEKIWKAIVSIFKVTIVIKTPAVLIGNVVSNFLYSLMVGIPLNEVYRGHMDAIEALNEYQKNQRELDKLEILNKSKPSKDLEVQIRNLKRKMKDSPIADMMEAGMFTAIIEDVEAAELEDPNRLTRRIDEFMESMPQFVRTGADYLYMTKRTPVFKWFTKATQYSDFISRYTLMEHYKKVGMKLGLTAEQAKEIAMSEAIEAFINYDLADSKMLQYANEMGLAMFTKYMIRIQKVIRKGIVKHPIQFISALLGQVALFDVSDITESMLFVSKNPLDNVNLDPTKILSGVLTPPSVEIFMKYIK